MLNEPTLEKLKALKLNVLANAWLEQQGNPNMAQLDFEERFGLLVDAEWLYRENRRLARVLKEAKLRLPQACIEEIDCAGKRDLDKGVVRQLATCRWVQEHRNAIISGATGTGRPSSPAPSRSKPAARATAPSIAARRGCSTS